jgi:hypothetical protein
MSSENGKGAIASNNDAHEITSSSSIDAYRKERNRKVCCTLKRTDIWLLLDGAEIRAESWEATAKYLRTGKIPMDTLLEDCDDKHEAAGIARRYRRIFRQVNKQIKA